MPIVHLLARVAVTSVIAICSASGGQDRVVAPFDSANDMRGETATWLFRTDLECRWSIDGEPKGVLHFDDRVRMNLGLGDHLIEAVPTAGGARWEQVINVKESETKVFTIPLRAAKNAAEAKAKREELGHASEATQRLGYWIDPDTHLMWAARDSGIVNWSDAAKYCRQLKIGGYRDWRLPMIEEVERMRDPDLRSPKGGVKSNGLVWSGTQGQTPREAWTFDFQRGGIEPKPLDYDGGLLDAMALAQHKEGSAWPSISMATHALCIRH